MLQDAVALEQLAGSCVRELHHSTDYCARLLRSDWDAWRRKVLAAADGMDSTLLPRNCSLVSSSAALRGRGWGTAIDASNGLVVRLGLTPTQGATSDVGTRTSARFLAANHRCLRHEGEPTLRTLLEAEHGAAYLWLAAEGDARGVRALHAAQARHRRAGPQWRVVPL